MKWEELPQGTELSVKLPHGVGIHNVTQYALDFKTMTLWFQVHDGPRIGHLMKDWQIQFPAIDEGIIG